VACEKYEAVKPGVLTVKDAMTVQSARPWVRINPPFAVDGPDMVWTLDGLSLNSLLIYGGLEDGKVLLEVQGSEKVQPPKFSSGMDGLELQELISATVSRALAGGVAARMLSLDPVTFMGEPGFETEFSYPSRSGLEMRGFAEGAVIGGKLYMVMFFAPRIHYFGKDIGEVRQIASSARKI
jgi:hypothetical protein